MTDAADEPAPPRPGETGRPVIAFHAPMKPPDHPVPSGDRTIARLSMRALERAGFAPVLVSSMRTLDMEGSPARQRSLIAEAELEAERLLERFGDAPPAAWFTYHNYWKAPDLIGPRVAGALQIPYVISEASHSPKRMDGSWALFAEAALHALREATLVYWTTRRDRAGLEKALEIAPGARDPRLLSLPPFLDIGPRPRRAEMPEDPEGPLRLLAIAMMRPGDKMQSFAALAAAVKLIGDEDWRLSIIGDGEGRAAVRDLFDGCAGRVEFAGMVSDPALLREAYEASELLVWPGVNEGVGMTFLEAQAAGLPCLCEDRPALRDVVQRDAPLPGPGDAAAFAGAIRRAAADRRALAASGRAARLHMEEMHSLDAAAARLRADLGALIGEEA